MKLGIFANAIRINMVSERVAQSIGGVLQYMNRAAELFYSNFWTNKCSNTLSAVHLFIMVLFCRFSVWCAMNSKVRPPKKSAKTTQIQPYGIFVAFAYTRVELLDRWSSVVFRRVRRHSVFELNAWLVQFFIDVHVPPKKVCQPN